MCSSLLYILSACCELAQCVCATHRCAIKKIALEHTVIQKDRLLLFEFQIIPMSQTMVSKREVQIFSNVSSSDFFSCCIKSQLSQMQSNAGARQRALLPAGPVGRLLDVRGQLDRGSPLPANPSSASGASQCSWGLQSLISHTRFLSRSKSFPRDIPTSLFSIRNVPKCYRRS